jgi:uncharacterized protein
MRVIIVHGWGFTPEDNWYPWLKGKLVERGFDVLVPEMSETLVPHISVWVNNLVDAVENSSEDTILIGHSIGCQTIVRYLAETNRKFSKVILIAGWFQLDKKVIDDEIGKYGAIVGEVVNEWENTPIDFEKARNNCTDISVLLSINEPYGCVEENRKVFEEKLGAQVTVLENRGHFTADDGVTEIPEVLEFFQ